MNRVVSTIFGLALAAALVLIKLRVGLNDWVFGGGLALAGFHVSRSQTLEALRAIADAAVSLISARRGEP